MIRTLLLAGLLLAPAAAWADPATIGFIIGASFEIGAIAITVKAVLVVGLYVYGAARARRSARKAQAKARAEYNANLQDRSITALQALPSWRIVTGRCITGGDIHAIFTTDKTGYREDGSTYTRPDALKHLVVVLADHECQAVHEVYIDGIACGPLDGSGYVTTVSPEFYQPRVDSRTATIGGGGSVTVGQAVVTVLNAYIQVGNGDNYSTTDVTGSVSLTGGNLTINGPAGATVNYTVLNDLPSVRIQIHLGTSTQAVDTYLNSVVPSQWTSTDRLLDKCYLVVTLDLENQRFQGSPPGITADVSGRKVYDPRKDSTVSGGSGSHRSNDPATWEWSDNPALAVRDYLTAEWGVAAAHADINDAGFTIGAANACDARASAAVQAKSDTVTASASTEEITFTAAQPYTVGDGVRFTTTGTLPAPLAAGTTYYIVKGRSSTAYKLATSVANAYAGTTIDLTSAGTGTHTCTFYDYATYDCNGMFWVEDGQREAVLEDLAETMGGNAVYSAQWEIVAAAWASTVMDLGDDDLAGQIEIVTADTPLEQLINGVRGTFIPAGKSVAAEFDNYSNATFVSDDGQEQWADVALPYVDTAFRARNLARILVETTRNGQIIRYPAKLKAWPLQRGDRVRISSTEYGLSLKTYRVTDWQDAPTAVVLTLQEDDAAAYDLADAATTDATPNTGLGSPWVVQSLTLGTITSGSGVGIFIDGAWLPRVKVPWTAVTDPYLADGAGRIVVLWRTPRDGTTWQRMELLSSETSALLAGVREGDLIVVEVYARNALGQVGASSFASHTVATTNNGTIGGGNLLRNAMFGVDSDADGLADNWTLHQLGTHGTVTPSLVSGGMNGSLAQRIDATNLGTTGGDQAGVTQVVELAGHGGKPFALSAYVFGGAAGTPDCDLAVGFYTGAGATGTNISNADFIVDSPGAGPVRYINTGTIPSNALSCIVYLIMFARSSSAGAAAIAFDDVQLEIAAVPTAFAPRADELLPGVVTSDMLADALAADIDGKIVSYFQASAPGTATEGDLWFDTDDSNKSYRWTSGAWTSSTDTRISTAITNAATAQSTADGKIVTFIQTSAPTAVSVGDLWFDSDDGYKAYRATATGAGNWVAYQFGTSALDSGAATPSRQVSYPSDGTLSWSSGSGAIPPQQQIGILSYTNNTGRSVTVEMSASLNAKGTGGTGTAGGRLTIDTYCDDGSSAIREKVTWITRDVEEAAAGGVLTETVANGGTINFRLYALLKTTSSGTWSAGSIDWNEASMRMTVIAA